MLTLQNIEMTARENHKDISFSTTYHMHLISSHNTDLHYFMMFLLFYTVYHSFLLFVLFYSLSHSFLFVFFCRCERSKSQESRFISWKIMHGEKAVSSPISSFLWAYEALSHCQTTVKISPLHYCNGLFYIVM